MVNFSTLARCFGSRPRHHLLFSVAVGCLLFMSTAFPLNAQSCTEYWTCDCNTTINPGFCNECSTGAATEALGCALSGNCDWRLIGDAVFAQCMTKMGPPQPPPATNDAIVLLKSQLAGFTATPTGNPVSGLIHSKGTAKLGFTGPGELDAASTVNAVQSLVLRFLNESPQPPEFHPLR